MTWIVALIRPWHVFVSDNEEQPISAMDVKFTTEKDDDAIDSIALLQPCVDFRTISARIQLIIW